MALKVALLVHRFPPYLGGCEMYSLKLAEGLTGLGHDVTVFTTKHPDRGSYPFEIREFTNVNPPKSGYFFWPAFFKPSVLGELQKFQVIHAVDFSMFATFGGLLAGKISSVPTVLTTFYHPPSAMPHPWLKSAYDGSAGRLVLSGYGAIIVHSQFELSAITHNVSQVCEEKLHMIPSGPIIEGVSPSGGFRDRYGLKDKYIALYVGRIDSNKGTDHLLQAVHSLHSAGAVPGFVLALVGEEEQWYHWPRETARLLSEMDGQVVFTGRLFGAELASAYAESNIMVMPSKYESFGFTIIEALSYGTPVVATRVGIAPEVIVDGVNGYLYDFGDTEGLKRAILQMARQDGSLRQNAMDSVTEYRWDRTLETITNLYYNLLRPSRRSRV